MATWSLLSLGNMMASGYTLTLSTNGLGSLTRDNTNSLLPPGATITITATASNGWYFSSWSGAVTSTVNPLQVTMNSNLVITGNFLPFPTYSVVLTTNGQGSIALNPPGGSYYSNSQVTATATAATGWVFVAWSGLTNTSANPISFPANTNLSLAATFAQLPAFDVQPVSVTNKITSTVSFSAHAVGTAPLGYQWFFSEGALPFAATNTTLTLTNVSTSQAGNYWLVATNPYGTATSHIASLTLTNYSGPTNIVSSPDDSSLRAAINLGGWIGFGFNGAVTLSSTIYITNSVILDGNNVAVTIDGGSTVRLFYVEPGASLTVTNLRLANGCYLITTNTQGTNADAGAIYNQGGTINLVGTTLTNNTAASAIWGGVARGGAIFNDGGGCNLAAKHDYRQFSCGRRRKSRKL